MGFASLKLQLRSLHSYFRGLDLVPGVPKRCTYTDEVRTVLYRSFATSNPPSL